MPAVFHAATLSGRAVLRTLLWLFLASSVAFASAAPTATSLTVLPGTAVSERTILSFTATVKASGVPVPAGLLKFCDMQTAAYCEDAALLGSVWVTKAGTATLRMPLSFGSHKIQAMFQATSTYAASVSAPVSVDVVSGSLSTLTQIPSSSSYGYGGLYQAQTTVTGAPVPALSGTLSFVDTSNANYSLTSVSVGTSSVNFTPLTSVGGPSIQQPQYTAVGDFNLDGKLDFVVASNLGNTAQVFLGNGDGTFTPPTTLTTDSPNAVLVADLNGDGKPDIAVLNLDTIAIYLGNGDGTFTLKSTPSTGDWGYGFTIADFNGDGIPDFAITENYVNAVQILFGNGDGTFQLGPSFPTGNNPEDIVAADFNRDGHTDLAFVNQMDYNAMVLLGDGNGNFTAGPTISLSESPYTLAVGDFNGDGIPDLAISALIEGAAIFTGAGDGSFTQVSTVTCGSAANGYGIATADFNQDGKTDLVVGGALFFGDGAGNFSVFSYVGGNGSAVSIGDFNGDGSPDLITPVYSSNSPFAGNVYLSVEQATASLLVAPIRVLGPGVHNVVASYSGDALHAPSQSTAVAMTGAQINTTLALSVYPGTSVSAGDTVQIVAALNPASVGNFTPGGTVTFYDGAAVLGSGVLLAGQATFSTNILSTASHSIKAVYAGDTNFVASTSPVVVLTVGGKATPVITWPTPTAITYGTALSTTQLNASTTVPGQFVYTPATGTVLAAGARTLSVTFTPTDTTTYNSASATVTLTVLRAPLTVTGNNATMFYGSTLPTFAATYNGFVNGDSQSALSGAPSLTTTATTASSVGNYPITAALGTLSAANYAFTFVNGMLTISRAVLTVTANNATRPYGTANPTLTASYSGFVNGDTPSVLSGAPNVTTTAGLSSAVGNYAIVAAQGTLAATNYSFTFVSGALSVTQAPLTITASNQTKTYGQTLNLGTTAFTSSGLKNSETVGSVTLASAGAAASASVSGSPYAITPSNAAGGTFTAANYNIIYVNGQLTVNKATPTVSQWPSASAIIYGQSLGLSTLTGGTASVAGAFSFTNPNSVPNAGTASQALTFTPTDTTDYNAVAGTANVVVNKAPLKVTSTATKSYGDANPTLAPTYTGFVNGDTAASLSGAPTLATSVTQTTAAGTYSITVTVGTLTSSNYTFTFVAGTFTVTKAPLTITASDRTKLCGTTLTMGTTAFSATGLKLGQTIGAVTLTSTGSAAAATVAGSPYPIVPSNARTGTFNINNYAVTYVNGALTVTQGTSTTALTSDSPDPSKAGTSFTVGFRVSPASPVPTGTVTVVLSNPAATTCTGTLDATGNGTCVMTPPSNTPNANYTLTGTYSGDSNYLSSAPSAGRSHHVN